MAEPNQAREQHRRQRAKRAKRIGKRIKKARDGASLTQSELAELIGVTQVAIHHWETGNAHPSEWLFPELAKHLGESESWLRGEAA